jgi:meiotically up-regulated gene 157 (Mug157) protein
MMADRTDQSNISGAANEVDGYRAHFSGLSHHALTKHVVALDSKKEVAAAKNKNLVPELTLIAAGISRAHDRASQMFKQGFLNGALHSKFEPDSTVFVETGDIKAEWLRDSTAQMRPYLFFAKDNRQIDNLIRGVIAGQAKDLVTDPYANAFDDKHKVRERKFELDSIAAPPILAWTYWKRTGDRSIFTNEFGRALSTVLDTMATEQDHQGESRYHSPGLSGNAVGSTGMIWSGFRTSDDACRYNFNIPQEMMAVSALKNIEEIERVVYKNDLQADCAHKLAEEVHDGIEKYGIVNSPHNGPVYAYEVDGLGRFILGDDANVPSLLSSPYLGYLQTQDAIYQNTRRLALSEENSNYFSGRAAKGIGSTHTKYFYKGENIWPLALVMQGLTADNAQERNETIEGLLRSSKGSQSLHESFDKDDPTKFTRQDFGWPNSLFAEMFLLQSGKVKPLPMAKITDFLPASNT